MGPNRWSCRRWLRGERVMEPLEDETTRFLEAWMQVRQMVQAANFNRFQRAGLSATQFMTLNVIPKDGMSCRSWRGS